MATVTYRRSLDGINSFQASVTVIEEYTVLCLLEMKTGVLIAFIRSVEDGTPYVIFSMDDGATWGAWNYDVAPGHEDYGDFEALRTYQICDVEVLQWSGSACQDHAGRLVFSAKVGDQDLIYYESLDGGVEWEEISV